MWNRLKAILADFIQQADLVLLGLCCAATLYGMVLIASATHYMDTDGMSGMIRYVGVQGAAMVLGICAYIFMSMLDLERLMRRWKWLVAFNVVFIALLLTPFGVSDNTGNTAWLKFPFLPFSIGPAEVVKITFTLLLAKQLEWLREVKRDLKSFPSALMVAGHTIALMGWYVGISGDMGNGLTFFFIFLCMAFAALSTVIAVFENILRFSMDQWDVTRKRAVAINGPLLALLSLPCVLGFSVWSGMQIPGIGDIQSLEDFLVSNNFLVLGALVFALFCTRRSGWGWKNFLAEANEGEGMAYPKFLYVWTRYGVPLLIIVIFVAGWVPKITFWLNM